MSRKLGKPFWCSLGAAFGLTLLAGACSPGSSSTSDEPVGTWQSALTATFRADTSNSDDVYISNQNGGNGVAERSGTQIFAWKKTGTGPYEAEAIIRFKNLTLPAGSQVTSASLTLTFENWYTGFTLRGYYLKNAWNAAVGAPLGWLNRDTGLTWNTPGAKGVGTDVLSGLSFSNATWAGTGEEVKTFNLDTGVVQGWIDTPATNQGVILVNNEANDKYLRIYSSDDTVVTRRPLLTINYTTGGSGGSGGSGGMGGSGGAGSGGAAHPRIWLDASTLSSLRQRASNGDAQWQTLETLCNSYLPGTVTSSEGQCTSPNVCGGYKGEDYVNPLMSEALCYQIGISTGESNALQWGNKGVAILTALAGHTTYDDGEAIRNYGIAAALGYDWLYPLLTTQLKSTLHDRINGRLGNYETASWSRHHPHGNYYAGYYAAKAYAALATEAFGANPDNPSAPAHWTSFLNLQRGGANTVGSHTGVAAYYTSYLNGNVWSEGWQYGASGVRNMSLPALAAKTAKNVDLIGDPSAPYQYPLKTALPIMHATWPSRNYMDDRDTVRGVSTGSCPSIIGNAKPNPFTIAVTHTMLTRWNDTFAPTFHSWAKAIRPLVGTGPAWAEFLFWNEAAPDADFQLQPKSHFAANYAAMRSDWGTTATWGSLRASGYVDNPDAAEQYPDAGALAIVRGGTPFLVNPAFLNRCYGSTDASWDDPMRDDYIGGPSEMFNTFYNGPTNGTAGQRYGAAVAVDASSPPLTRISAFEDRNGYVFVRAVDLEDTYRPGSNITAWGRDVVYLRTPGVFVVYDRTQVVNTSDDQHMNWHFPPTPAPVSAPTGSRRYDVSDTTGGFKGAITTVLPAGALINNPLDNVFASGKLFRLEVRPPTPATTMRWLTVLDPATSSPNVLPASLVTSSSNIQGVFLAASSSNKVVLFGNLAGSPLAPPITFSVTAAATTVVMTDLAPSTNYTVSVTASGGNHNVSIQPGSGIASSAKGVLYFNIAAGGGVTPGT
jgi:hypothetical protein